VRLVFWSCLSLIASGYAGYPIYLYFRARFRARPVQRQKSVCPSVSVILAVRNEAKGLPDKLHNLDALDYPRERLEIIAVSDGSADETNEILLRWQIPGRCAILLPSHQGKSAALNHGIARARGEIICFVDATQTIAPNGLKNLLEPFADPSVGCVSGELVTAPGTMPSFSDGVGLYWRFETQVRKWESLTGSTVGASGAFYAVRRDLLAELPQDTILDDVYIPIQVARRGQRVIFEPRAQAVEHRTFSPREEFRRKVRTLTGNYQLLNLAPWVLTRPNPIRLRFICHKLVRLLGPFALVGLLISAFLIRRGVYELALVAQIAFYGLAALAMVRARVGFLSRLSSISLAFLILNTAAAVAFLYFISGRRPVWVR
jgi:poly-beta-1,6-N-acetyl-D-glucosamine synthase